MEIILIRHGKQTTKKFNKFLGCGEGILGDSAGAGTAKNGFVAVSSGSRGMSGALPQVDGGGAQAIPKAPHQ